MHEYFTYDVMLRFIPQDEAAPDEIAAITVGAAEYSRGQFLPLESLL